MDNEEAVLRSRHFRFSDVYGPDWRDGRDNLARFYVRQLACKLAEAKLLAPSALVDFLNGRARQPSGLTMWFEVAQDVLAFLRASRADGEQFSPGMGHGGLRAELTTSGEILQLQTFASCRWLVLRYFLDNNSRPPRPNFLRSNRVRLLEGFGHFADNDPSAGPASDLSA